MTFKTPKWLQALGGKIGIGHAAPLEPVSFEPPVGAPAHRPAGYRFRDASGRSRSMWDVAMATAMTSNAGANTPAGSDRQRYRRWAVLTGRKLNDATYRAVSA